MMNDRAVALISISAVSIASSLFLLSLIKPKGKQCTCNNTVKNKVVVITGANSGIGFEAARQLALYGARVYLCCRNEESGEKAVAKIKGRSRRLPVYFIPLDLCSLESCRECAALLFLRESKVDILIHNAGIFHADPTITVDGFEVHYQTNFLGPVALTEKLLPLLIESPSPRVIFTSSEAHKIPSLEDIDQADFLTFPTLANFDAHVKNYGTTKLALKLYAGYLADINKESPFTVTSVNPGNVWTGIYRTCWNRWFQWPMRLLCSIFMKSPADGAQSIIHAANAEDLRNGSYIEDCSETFPFLTVEEESYSKKMIDEVFTLLNIS